MTRTKKTMRNAKQLHAIAFSLVNLDSAATV